MKKLSVLSGGAAQGLVRALADEFEEREEANVSGTYGAVGAMKQKFTEGLVCDVLILTRKVVDELAASGHVRADSVRDIGVVKTGLAVVTGVKAPDYQTPQAMRQLLSNATAIYFPDPLLATAGIHFMKVLKKLGIEDQVTQQLRPYPNGATAMKALAQSGDHKAVGCTQVTEILITPGVTLLGDLPKAYELATTYTAAVSTKAPQAELAHRLIDVLCDPAQQVTRQQSGFLEV